MVARDNRGRFVKTKPPEVEEAAPLVVEQIEYDNALSAYIKRYNRWPDQDERKFYTHHKRWPFIADELEEWLKATRPPEWMVATPFLLIFITVALLALHFIH